MEHKWHKEIKAWADGAEIEYNYYSENDVEIWNVVDDPKWSIDDADKYRIKPQPKEPQYLYVSQGKDGKPNLSFIDHQESIGKIKLEVDDD